MNGRPCLRIKIEAASLALMTPHHLGGAGGPLREDYRTQLSQPVCGVAVIGAGRAGVAWPGLSSVDLLLSSRLLAGSSRGMWCLMDGALFAPST